MSSKRVLSSPKGPLTVKRSKSGASTSSESLVDEPSAPSLAAASATSSNPAQGRDRGRTFDRRSDLAEKLQNDSSTRRSASRRGEFGAPGSYSSNQTVPYRTASGSGSRASSTSQLRPSVSGSSSRASSTSRVRPSSLQSATKALSEVKQEDFYAPSVWLSQIHNQPDQVLDFLSTCAAQDGAEARAPSESAYYAVWYQILKESPLCRMPHELIEFMRLIVPTIEPQGTLEHRKDDPNSYALPHEDEDVSDDTDSDVPDHQNDQSHIEINVTEADEDEDEDDADSDTSTTSATSVDGILAKECAARAKSTRIPDFVQRSYLWGLERSPVPVALGCNYQVPSFRASRAYDSLISKGLVTLIIEIKPDFDELASIVTPNGDIRPKRRTTGNGTRLSTAWEQVRQQAMHFFLSHPLQNRIGVVLAFGRFYTYREYTRSLIRAMAAIPSLTKPRDAAAYKTDDDLRAAVVAARANVREIERMNRMRQNADLLNKFGAEGRIFIDVHQREGKLYLKKIHVRAMRLCSKIRLPADVETIE